MKPIVARCVLAALVLSAAAVTGASQPLQPQQQPQPYRPGVGDLMTATIQPRHTKIALAGRETNWRLAKYELHQLQEALDRVVQAWPRWKGLPLGGMVEAVEKGPMAAVDEAIDAKDTAQFDRAFAQLSDGCNACHQAANVGFVVVKSPDASNFPDQNFHPVKP